MDATSSPVPTVPLGGAVQIPQLGFGVFQVPPAETAEAVAHALEAGYRHIDTAAAYRNERGVGEAVRASGIARENVFVTTKCWNEQQGYEASRAAFDASEARLDVGALDLYLIHWPVPSQDLYLDTWRTFCELQDEGRVRAIGVSNFQPAHLRRVVEESGRTPAINQIELHPYFQQAELRRVHAELGIVTESWSPLAQGAVLEDPAIVAIAGAHGKTPGQVVIRWHLQLGCVVIPKSVTPSRIRENFDVLDFELSDAEMEAIEDLDSGRRIGPDPDVFVSP
ncbi:MAG TPA: aldo/keto reductase [Solirubrobacteraceae bacterium]|nr:aldo/keto reductase [Solirubrobacteraceae bacterium]